MYIYLYCKMTSNNQGLAITINSLPWLLGWASFSVFGPIVFLKVIYKTCLLALAYFSDNNKIFHGKLVMITGASSGLGKALAHVLYKKGCKLILLSRNVQALEELKQALLTKYNPPELHVPVIGYLDLEDLNSIPKIVNNLIEKFGCIDILISCAGISYRGDVISTDISVDLKVMIINYFGQIALIKAVLKDMINKKKEGHIIGISSVQGKLALPFRSCYGASKHALHSFLDCLRAEVAHKNIAVTTVSPGYMETNLSLNALTSTGEKYGVMDDTTASGMSPDYVAQRIANCVICKPSELVICPYLHKFLIFIQSFFPSLYFYIMKLRANRTKSKVMATKKD